MQLTKEDFQKILGKELSVLLDVIKIDLKTGLSEIQKDFKVETIAIRQDIVGLREDMGSMKEEINILKEQIILLNEKIDSVRDELLFHMTISFEAVRKELADIRASIENLHKRTKEDDEVIVSDVLKLRHRIEVLEKQYKKLKDEYKNK